MSLSAVTEHSPGGREGSANCPLCQARFNQRRRAAVFRRCDSCGLLVRNAALTTAEIKRLYRGSWSRPETARSETGGTELIHSRVYARDLAKTLGRSDFRGLKLCDFGAGRGAMVEALTELGAEVYAIEPFGYDFLSSRGLRAFRSLDELPAGLLFDGVVSISVLEHLAAPWCDLARLRSRLKPGGFAWLTTPNAAGLTARVAGKRWREALRPGHLTLLTPSTMERILREAGFASFRRLKWLVGYRRGPRKFLIYMLQAVGWDGELRYLAAN